MPFNDKKILALNTKIIHPFDESKVQPASYDLSLSAHILIPKPEYFGAKIDLRASKPSDYARKFEMKDEYIMKPHDCILASTNEFITCPDDAIARVEGKSSIGRLFLIIHTSSGFVDPGFSGQITLEIVNHSPWNIVLWKSMSIAQINFIHMDEDCARPYGSQGLGSHYQGQSGPVASAGERNKS